MSKKKIENMTVSEIEEEIKRLKEAKSAQAVREKQAARKALVHRKIMIGGVVYSALRESGLDLSTMDEEAFKASVDLWGNYISKYIFNIKKAFQPEPEEVAGNATVDTLPEWAKAEDEEKP